MAREDITGGELAVNVIENHLIPFINIANECCEVFDEDFVGEWFFTPNSNLSEKMPIEYMDTDEGRCEILKLLRFIEIDEADII
tara:strand:- start:1215 stop:1466 length:252 start_codon:yes stop_codon:yes gene_type:complete